MDLPRIVVRGTENHEVCRNLIDHPRLTKAQSDVLREILPYLEHEHELYLKYEAIDRKKHKEQSNEAKDEWEIYQGTFPFYCEFNLGAKRTPGYYLIHHKTVKFAIATRESGKASTVHFLEVDKAEDQGD
jgi:hypothetical protein